MSEHVTPEECLSWMDVVSDHAQQAFIQRCGKTIEALQARIEAVDAVDYSEVSAQVMERQLAVKPPASVDTTKARLHAGTLRGTKEGRLLHQLADALDASRAEIRRLHLAVERPVEDDPGMMECCVCGRTWPDGAPAEHDAGCAIVGDPE